MQETTIAEQLRAVRVPTRQTASELQHSSRKLTSLDFSLLSPSQGKAHIVARDYHGKGKAVGVWLRCK
jgi:hypothetical protein